MAQKPDRAVLQILGPIQNIRHIIFDSKYVRQSQELENTGKLHPRSP